MSVEITPGLAGSTCRKRCFSCRTMSTYPSQFVMPFVAKRVMSPRPAYEPIAAEMILVDSPGATSADLATFDYAHLRRPLYPSEGGATYV